MSDLTPPEGQPEQPQYPAPIQPPDPAQPPAYPSQPAPSYPDPAQAPTYAQAPSYAQPSYQQPSYQQAPYGQDPYGTWTAQNGRDPNKRPGTVTAAAVTTWVATSLALIGILVVLGLAIADDDDFFTALLDDTDDFSRSDLRTGLIVGLLVLVFWALSALVLAFFAFRRHNWARIVLVISSVIAALGSLVAILAVVPLVLTIAAVATVVLLFTGGANDWYRAKDLPPAYPGQPAQAGPTFY